eukprot:10078443-Ditylum_brightwellii.AAC.1
MLVIPEHLLLLWNGALLWEFYPERHPNYLWPGLIFVATEFTSLSAFGAIRFLSLSALNDCASLRVQKIGIPTYREGFLSNIVQVSMGRDSSGGGEIPTRRREACLGVNGVGTERTLGGEDDLTCRYANYELF